MLKLHPNTVEKLQRFRKHRRAYVSFWLLVILFVVSLFSELIAHEVPWHVRFEGKSYWPRLRSNPIPQDTFLKDGVMTPPVYRDLAKHEVFASNNENRMRWAPIRLSPSTKLKAEEIDISGSLTLKIERLQRVEELRVRPDGKFRAGSAADWFLKGEDPVFPEEFLKAMEERYANQPMPTVRVLDASGRFEWSLSAYEPRSRAPRSLRVLMREKLPEDAEAELHKVEEHSRPEWWERLPEDLWIEAEERMERASLIPVEPMVFSDKQERQWQLSFLQETVQFPFRPVKGHPFGLDESGQDVLVLILYATRISLLFGFILVFSSMILGTIIGGLQGFVGGTLDLVGQRVIEIYEAIPFLYVMILLGTIFGRSFMLLLLIYAFFNWIGISYYMRAEFLKLRSQPFTEAAKALGLPSRRIMWKHILPNALVPIITFFPFSLVGAIGSLSSLDYLGFGLPAGTPSWGELLRQAQIHRSAWWLILYPSLTLFAVILMGVFIGEGLRAAFDPKREAHWEA